MDSSMAVFRPLGWMFLGATMCMALTSCGPRHLSALGNPGDFCTEASSCTDGTSCRPTEDGYRCVGNDEAERSRSKARRPVKRPRELVIEDDEENLGPSSDEEDEEEDTSSFDFSEEEDEAEDDPGYVPPSRRRRGGG